MMVYLAEHFLDHPCVTCPPSQLSEECRDKQLAPCHLSHASFGNNTLGGGKRQRNANYVVFKQGRNDTTVQGTYFQGMQDPGPVNIISLLLPLLIYNSYCSATNKSKTVC